MIRDCIKTNLLDWYRSNRRQLPWRETRDPYAIWVSEVMLQQTQVKTVIPYYLNFINHFPTVHDLATAKLQDVLKQWEGLGYYARARNLHKGAVLVDAHFGGIIPDNWDDMIRIPGIGDYIASAVLSIAFGLPFPVVDGNVKRVLARLLKMDFAVNISSSHRHYKSAAGGLMASEDAGTYNQALMELGAVICKPRNPLCCQCPLNQACNAFLTQTVDQFPRKKKKKKIPEYHIAIGVVIKPPRILITQRSDKGLLGGLWEFPGGKINKGEDSRDACIREIREEIGILVAIHSFLKTINHAYTHFKIRADVYLCNYVSGDIKLNGPVDYRWIFPDEIDGFPVPGANHKFIPELRGALNRIF